MIRDYKQVIEGLQALSEAPHTTRGQSELLKGAILVILELQKDLKSSEWLIEKLENARNAKNSGASETDFASNPEGQKEDQDAPKKAGRPKKLANGSATPEIAQ
jgi:hypothetical protein